MKSLVELEDKLRAVKLLDEGLVTKIRDIKDEAVQAILLSEAKRELGEILNAGEENLPRNKRPKLNKLAAKVNHARGMLPLTSYWNQGN